MSRLQPFWVDIVSTKASTAASGSIQVKIGFVRPDKADHKMDFKEVYDELLRLTQNAGLSIMSAPPVSCPSSIEPPSALSYGCPEANSTMHKTLEDSIGPEIVIKY